MADRTVRDRARYTAAVVLTQVIEEGAFSNIALKNVITEQHLSGKDAAFATHLVMGVLERKLFLDHVLKGYIKRWPGHPLVRQALRLGCYQVLFSDSVPDSAAVNSSVELCKTEGAKGLSGMVNGVLRNIIRNKDAIRIPDGPSAEDASLKYSCLPWMVDMLRAQYSEMEIGDILGFHPLPLTVYPNPLKNLKREQIASRLSEDGWEVKPGHWTAEALRLYGAGNIASHPLYRDGHIGIVSESAMLAVKAVDARPGDRVLDACAAPGGKSCLLAYDVGENGHIDAWDIHPHRVELIRAQVQRLGIGNVRAFLRDATVPSEDLYGTYDRVLCDMPCTGWGVLPQKPELRFMSEKKDMEALCGVQRRILECCAGYVKPGGSLVYVTCTVSKMENQNIIHSFLDTNKGFALDDLAPYLPEGLHSHVQEKGMIQLLSGRDNVPGFFICRMVRRG